MCNSITRAVPRPYSGCACVTVYDNPQGYWYKRGPTGSDDKEDRCPCQRKQKPNSVRMKMASNTSQTEALSMEQPTFTAKTEFLIPDHHMPLGLSSPEPESRGRKRRRDPISFTFTRPNHSPSVESCTLRGRCRHRSSSRLAFISSRASSCARHASSSSSKGRLLGVILFRAENHRRSQSPSRSRSPGDHEMASASKRRRQRTRSRSRKHNRDGHPSPAGPSQKPPLGLVYLHAQDSPRRKD